MPKRKVPESHELVVAGSQKLSAPSKTLTKSSNNQVVVGQTQQFEKAIVGKVDPSISKLLKFARDSYNQDIETVRLFFPQANLLFYPGRPGMPPGMPRGRIIEIFSKDTSVGKSSFLIKALAAWQHQFHKALLADPDGKTTASYLKDQGCVMDELDPRKMELVQIEPPNPTMTLSAEQWLEALQRLAPFFDIAAIDSIAALQKQSDLAKTMQDANMVGGLGQLLSNFCKAVVGKKTTVLFINQSRYAPGQFSPNGPAWTQTGGRAVRNFASIRAEMSPVMNGQIVDSQKNVLGFKAELKIVKNSIGPFGRKCTLNYVFGMGFSPWWDYLELGVKLGVIHRNKATHTFEKWTAQGERAFHNKMVHDPELFGRIQEVIDTKTIAQAFTGDAEELSKQEQEEEQIEDARATEEFGPDSQVA